LALLRTTAIFKLGEARSISKIDFYIAYAEIEKTLVISRLSKIKDIRAGNIKLTAIFTTFNN
jgi:hypothetical protein